MVSGRNNNKLGGSTAFMGKDSLLCRKGERKKRKEERKEGWKKEGKGEKVRKE